MRPLWRENLPNKLKDNLDVNSDIILEISRTKGEVGGGTEATCFTKDKKIATVRVCVSHSDLNYIFLMKDLEVF